MAAVSLGALVLVTACTSSGAAVDNEGAAPIDSNPLTELIKPKVTSTVADGAIGFSPGDPVRIDVADGSLSDVRMVNADGKTVAGTLAADGASWVTAEPLGYNRKYKIEAQAYGLGGASTTVTSFTTSAPGNLTKPYVMPGEGSVVGIGQPIAVQFDENIPDRKAAEESITVTTCISSTTVKNPSPQIQLLAILLP